MPARQGPRGTQLLSPDLTPDAVRAAAAALTAGSTTGAPPPGREAAPMLRTVPIPPPVPEHLAAASPFTFAVPPPPPQDPPADLPFPGVASPLDGRPVEAPTETSTPDPFAPTAASLDEHDPMQQAFLTPTLATEDAVRRPARQPSRHQKMVLGVLVASLAVLIVGIGVRRLSDGASSDAPAAPAVSLAAPSAPAASVPAPTVETAPPASASAESAAVPPPEASAAPAASMRARPAGGGRPAKKKGGGKFYSRE